MKGETETFEKFGKINILKNVFEKSILCSSMLFL